MPPAPGQPPAALDRAAVRAEMESARLDFHQIIADATPADLRRPTDGTRWTNRQLLFGYLAVRALLVLVRGARHPTYIPRPAADGRIWWLTAAYDRPNQVHL